LLETLDDHLARDEAVLADELRRGAFVDPPESVEDIDLRKTVALADLEVGVIFTAPEPLVGSAYSSATIGIERPTMGSFTVLPTRPL